MARLPIVLLAIAWPLVLALVLPWALAARWCESGARSKRGPRGR